MQNQIVPGVVRLWLVHINPCRIWSECTVHDLICLGICTTDPLTESLPITVMNLDYALRKWCHFALTHFSGYEASFLCSCHSIPEWYNLFSGVRLRLLESG